MLKLYGIPVSNYYNMVKHTLLVKGIPFGEVSAMPSQEPEYVARSPRGKVPCLETPDGFLSETNVIMDYLEDTHPQPALYPADAFARARTKQIMRIVEHYIEAPSHRFVGHVLFGAPKSPAMVKEVRPEVELGLAALGRVARFAPHIAGDGFTCADIFALHSLRLSVNLLQAVYDWDILGEVDGLRQWYDKESATDHAQAIFTAQREALEAMQARA